MTHKIFWYKENVVAFAELIGDVSEDELILVNEKLRDGYLEVGISPVHIVLDINGIASYPRNVKIVRKVSEITLKHPAMGWFIFIGFSNPLVRFIANTVSQVAGINFKHAGSLQEVDGILSKIDGRFRQETSIRSK